MTYVLLSQIKAINVTKVDFLIRYKYMLQAFKLVSDSNNSFVIVCAILHTCIHLTLVIVYYQSNSFNHPFDLYFRKSSELIKKETNPIRVQFYDKVKKN